MNKLYEAPARSTPPFLGPGTRVTQAAKDAEARSAFKKWQPVRACKATTYDARSRTIPHDHENPDHHFNSRVLWWDEDGKMVIAFPARADPHLAAYIHDEGLLRARGDQDWVSCSSVKPLERVTFYWEEKGFEPQVGERVLAVIVAPHTQPGDWLIAYRCQSVWRQRVLHEGKMVPEPLSR